MTDRVSPPVDTGRAHPSRVGVAVPTGGYNIRLVATGLLVVMAAIFVTAKYFQDVHPAVGFVRAFAEAAMVGGLADWFAVTALFRQPMGLDRKSVVEGKRVSVRVDLGGRRNIKKKNNYTYP